MRKSRRWIALLAVVLASGVTGAVAYAKPWKTRSLGGDHGSFSFGMSGGRLGAQVQSMTTDLRRYFGAPEDRGVLVAGVEPGSPAAAAGLRAGDVLVAVDGDAVEDVGDVLGALADKGKGDAVKLDVVRDKSRVTLQATLRDAGGGPDAFAFGAPGHLARGMLGRFLGSPQHMSGFALLGDDLQEDLQKLEQRLEKLEQRLEKLEGRKGP